MSYTALASYYDMLINEEDAQIKYLEFVNRHMKKSLNVLELGCGSGTLANMLKTSFIDMLIDATDLSADMINVAKHNYPHIDFFIMDMRFITFNKKYDTILCFCDTLNYLLCEKELIDTFSGVYEHLEKGGRFIFDAHSMDRLVEFSTPYDESNILEDLEYTWHIKCEDTYIHQTLRVWDDSVVPTYFFEEKHLQRVYDPKWIEKELINCGFSVEIYTDFDNAGILKGEKQFFVCERI